MREGGREGGREGEGRIREIGTVGCDGREDGVIRDGEGEGWGGGAGEGWRSTKREVVRDGGNWGGVGGAIDRGAGV